MTQTHIPGLEFKDTARLSTNALETGNDEANDDVSTKARARCDTSGYIACYHTTSSPWVWSFNAAGYLRMPCEPANLMNNTSTPVLETSAWDASGAQPSDLSMMADRSCFFRAQA